MRDPYKTAAEFKAQKIGRQESWSRWIQITGLNPGMDAKDWYAIYDSAIAYHECLSRPADFETTHFDELLQRDVEIKQDARGVYFIRWDDGHTGSNPPCNPPDPQRFTRRPNTGMKTDAAIALDGGEDCSTRGAAYA